MLIDYPHNSGRSLKNISPGLVLYVGMENSLTIWVILDTGLVPAKY